MRILLTLSYDGTDFCGYQIQPNGRTVEETLENALHTLTGEKIKTYASGRTDSGVHAVCQKVHFDTKSSIPPENFAPALNAILPSDVKVSKSKRVSKNFNARFSAKKKTYRYSLMIGNFEEPTVSRYKTLIKTQPNVSLMKECAKLIVGEHDFKAFMASGSSVQDTVRTVHSIKVTKKGKFIDVYVTGNGFLYNMVRIIVGAMLAVADGKATIYEIEDMLNRGERPIKVKTMPAKGLTLYSVVY